jgi:hypothetical protein
MLGYQDQGKNEHYYQDKTADNDCGAEPLNSAITRRGEREYQDRDYRRKYQCDQEPSRRTSTSRASQRSDRQSEGHIYDNANCASHD